MKPMVPTLILAAAIIVAGFVAAETSRPTYAVVNAVSGGPVAGFYRLNLRTGAVQMYGFDLTRNAWRCAGGTDSTCTIPTAPK
jgi:hypothetical protein